MPRGRRGAACSSAETAGLRPLLTDRAWRDLMETALDEVGDPDRLQAGAIAPATGQVLGKLKALVEIGYCWFAATPPFYLPPRSIEDHRRHFSILAEATAMGMIIYNIPACTGTAVPEAVLTEFAAPGFRPTEKHPNAGQGTSGY